jgi:transformation/transcription domain-associated protein
LVSQSLFFHLRTQSEDYKNLRRQHELTMRQRAAAAAAANGQGSSEAATSNNDSSTAESKTADTTSTPAAQSLPQLPGHIANSASGQQGAQPSLVQSLVPKQPWEAVDEIVSVLKTSFPLLALTLENMCDQFNSRFKPSADEDVFRLVNALLNDGLQVRYLRDIKVIASG